jgi:hypothetical protein
LERKILVFAPKLSSKCFAPTFLSKIPGRTAGARAVVEVYTTTGEVIRTWYESYDAEGRVIRVHPKTPQDLGHIEIDPISRKEIERW